MSKTTFLCQGAAWGLLGHIIFVLTESLTFRILFGSSKIALFEKSTILRARCSNSAGNSSRALLLALRVWSEDSVWIELVGNSLNSLCERSSSRKDTISPKLSKNGGRLDSQLFCFRNFHVAPLSKPGICESRELDFCQVRNFRSESKKGWK